MSKSLKIVNSAFEKTRNADLLAEAVHKAYKSKIEFYEATALKKRLGESLSSYDVIAIGEQLAQFDLYRKFQESTNNLGSLGRIPEIALDVIVAANAQSILPLISSTQSIPDEHSIVYFKDIVASDVRGYRKGEAITGPLTRDNVKAGTGMAGGYRFKKDLGDIKSGAAIDITANLKGMELPIRPRTFEVFIEGVGQGKDDGQGNFVAFGFEGTVNYETGVVKITSTKTPTADVKVQAIWDVDIDSADKIQKIQSQLRTKDVKAEIYALSTDVGHFASFAFSRRFGSAGAVEAAQDLTSEMTRLLNTRAVEELMYAAPAATAASTWYTKAPNGVAQIDHKMGFLDCIAGAETNLHLASGASGINRFIAGSKAAQTLRGMPDFVAEPNQATSNSISLFGHYDGVPVIRATGVVADDEIIAINSGADNYWNTPLVYAPFMPLMVTSTVQSVDNPFRSTQAAGTWAAFSAVNPNLTTRIKFKYEQEPAA